MSRRFEILLVTFGLIGSVSPSLPARGGPSSRLAKDAGPITRDEATVRLKRIPIVKAAIEQAGTKTCVFDYKKIRDLAQFEPGSAFEYKVRITCEAKRGEFESAAIIEIEGQNLNYGEALQDIDRLSFHVSG
jgi:hypothetical protein